MATTLWQLYDEQGSALDGKGCTKDEAFKQALLHGAAHVWIWRTKDRVTEVLLQKRAVDKRTWPGRYDISAAGHIDLGETPLQAALREAKEEINLNISTERLQFLGVHRTFGTLTTDDGIIENEFQWLYSLELSDGDTDFTLRSSEVESLVWVPMTVFEAECTERQYVPHSKLYYDTVIAALQAIAARTEVLLSNTIRSL